MSRAARDRAVIFFEEPVFRDGGMPRLEQRGVAPNLTVAVPILPAGSEGQADALQRRLLGDLLQSRAADTNALTFWYYTPMALGFSDGFGHSLCVYDCMDELSAFRFAPPELAAREARLFATADLVFTGGCSLYEAKRGRHPSVHLFPSSIDHAHFARARGRQVSEPDDQRAIGRPRLGYFGVVDERMDLDLVAGIADLRPDWQILMLGPVVKVDPATLPRRGNIHWLGLRPYAQLPSYLAGWDLGLMPFALNESTRFISPTKTPEYLAAGLQVVSTPIADVVRSYGENGLVRIAGTAEQAVAAAAELMRQDRGSWLSRADEFLAGTSWDLTWAGMKSLMQARASLAPAAAPATVRSVEREARV
jgi:hypothetical protein